MKSLSLMAALVAAMSLARSMTAPESEEQPATPKPKPKKCMSPKKTYAALPDKKPEPREKSETLQRLLKSKGRR